MPEIFEQFRSIAEKLERHYRDMQDIELTIERGKLYILQTRNGKRTAQAALKIAHDMVGEGLIDKKEALLRIDPEHLAHVLHRQIDSSADLTVLAAGLAASPGAAFGSVVFDANEAEHLGRIGSKVILVRVETTPGRHPRHRAGTGHPDQPGRHDQPRGGRDPGHGQAVRVRLRGRQGRL